MCSLLARVILNWQEVPLVLCFENLCDQSNLWFGWRVILNKLPTRDQQVERGVISSDYVNSRWCALCFHQDENNHHLFIDCHISRRLWDVILNWVGRQVGGIEWSLSSSFIIVISGSQQIHDIVSLIWLSTTWNVIISSNVVMFKKGFFNFKNCLLSIKFLSWKWTTLYCKNYFICSFVK